MKINRKSTPKVRPMYPEVKSETTSPQQHNKVLDAIILTISETKTHGVSNIIKSNNKLLKLIWICSFLCSAIYCVFQICNTVLVYFSFGIVENNLAVYESPTKFPAVTVCNLNAYDGNTANKYIYEILKQHNLVYNQSKQTMKQLDNANLIIKSNLDEMAKNGKFDQWYNGFLLEQMLISCKYYNSDCDIDDFYYFHDYDYGNCYTFNAGFTNKAGHEKNKSKPIKLSTRPGAEYGLSLELYIGNIEKQQQFSFKTGVRVIVHNQSVVPFAGLDGINAPTGSLTSIAVSRTFVKHLPSPYSSNCMDIAQIDWNKNDVLQFMKSSFKFGIYNQNYCFFVCLQQFLIKNCDCYNLRYPLKNEKIYKSCTNQSEILCLINKTDQFYANSHDTLCYKKCPAECTEVIYQLEINQAAYPSDWYSNYLLNNTLFLDLIVNNSGTNETRMAPPTLDSLAKTTLMINLFYNDMYYFYVSEAPTMSFDIMLACIGGNLGLFLGCSLLFFVEIIEIIFHIVYISFHKYIKKFMFY